MLMLSMLDNLKVVSDPSNLSFHFKLHCDGSWIAQTSETESSLH
jgi:hypothetical protein